MYKVAKILIDRFHIDQGIKIHIYKHIPTQAGLAGGSADGAAVLKAMNWMFHLDILLATPFVSIPPIPSCLWEVSSTIRSIST